jgi:CPA2 family monovalent cation:H+ antiporter-2
VLTLPLRDAFAVLFFVSVGMLFNPAVVIEQPLLLVATVAIIVIGKSLAAYAIVRLLKHDHRTAITAAASLAQIGEFSFILASLGTGLQILPPEGRDLILAGALISIFVNPFIFNALVPKRQEKGEPVEPPNEAARRRDHVVLVGYGRVGKLIARDLKARGKPFILIEDQPDMARAAKDAGLDVVRGNALDPAALHAAGIDDASKLLIAIPEGFEGGAVVEAARAIRPDLAIIARAHSDAEVAHLEAAGAGEVVMGEREIANRMLSLCAVPLART